MLTVMGSIRRMRCQLRGASGTVLWSALLPTSRETVVTHTGLGQGGGVRQGLPYRHHVEPVAWRGSAPVTATQPGLSDYVAKQTRPAMEAVGGFVRMCVLTAKALFRRPFQWREFILQSWFLFKVSFLPTLAVSIPLTVLLIFTLNILLDGVRRRRHLGRGRGAGRRHPAGPAGNRARRRRRRLDGDLRRPRRPHHPRGDRRARGAGHRPDPPAGGAARGRLDVRRTSTQRRGDHHRPGRRLHLRRLSAERLRGCLRVDADAHDRAARGVDIGGQGRRPSA